MSKHETHYVRPKARNPQKPWPTPTIIGMPTLSYTLQKPQISPKPRSTTMMALQQYLKSCQEQKAASTGQQTKWSHSFQQSSAYTASAQNRTLLILRACSLRMFWAVYKTILVEAAFYKIRKIALETKLNPQSFHEVMRCKTLTSCRFACPRFL